MCIARLAGPTAAATSPNATEPQQARQASEHELKETMTMMKMDQLMDRFLQSPLEQRGVAWRGGDWRRCWR